MKPNPGGVLTGDAIVNREKEIDLIWNALQNQSVVLMSERRVGKTSVLRKMLENPKNGWIPIQYEVEGKWHPIEFVEGLYETLLEKDVLRKIEEEGFVPKERGKRKLGRNGPCHCGSGKKYKKCCLNKDIEKYGRAIKVSY